MSGHHDHCAHAAVVAGLTPGRRAALDALTAAGRAVGAYELIDILQKKEGRRFAPTQIYRALDFLVEQGLAHRLASRNAFLACGHCHHVRQSVAFLICERCGAVEEAAAPELDAALSGLARARNFAQKAQIVELSGLCHVCAAA